MRRIGMLLLGLGYLGLAKADFLNGGFEEPWQNNPNGPNVSIPNWTSTGYLFTGYSKGLVLPPKSLDDIVLVPTNNPQSGINDIIKGTTQSLWDYFLDVASPVSSLKLPEVNNQTASINLKWQNARYSVAGTSAKPSGWATYGKQATALAQTITLNPGDFNNGKLHIRFKIAAVMENPEHTAKQQPFYAIQVNNLTTNRNGKDPLYFQWSYAAQPGVPWKFIAQKGTNPGSNRSYTYTDWQNYDLTFAGTEVKVGDQIELIVLAAGCSPGGHDGHVYLDNVTTGALTGLSISATGSPTTSPGGTITYIYHYANTGASPAANVKIEIHMPQTQNSATPFEAIYQQFTSPSGGSCNYQSYNNTLVCSIPSLAQGADGTFTMTVNIPGDWPISYGPINHGNYPISADGINPSLGNLVQTTMQGTGTPPPPTSFLEVDTSGLLIDGKNPEIDSGTSYSGSYKCSNQAATTATNATCDISNLPAEISKTGCVITPSSNPWTQPQDIPGGATVTCHVSGTPNYSSSTELDVLVSSDASNNQNSSTNSALQPFRIYNNPVEVPASLDGSPVLTPVRVCCGRPVVLYDLPIASDLAATYTVIATTGGVRCEIGQSAGNSFVKLFGRPGTCTVQGTKDGQISKPLILNTV